MLDDNEDYRKALENIHDSYKEELQTVRDEAAAKIAYPRGQADRLQKENDNLWAENIWKSRIVETFFSTQRPNEG